MNEISHHTCQWHGCNSSASRVVAYERRIFGSTDLEEGTPTQGKRLALCPGHALKIRDFYLDISDRPLHTGDSMNISD